MGWNDFVNKAKNVGRVVGDATGVGLPGEIYNEVTGGGAYGPTSTISYGMDNMMGGDPKNPADSAMKYLDQIPGQLHEIYDPYMKHGQDAYGGLNDHYNSMMKDPAAYLDNIMKGYEPSKGYQFHKDEMLKAAGNTAAAGGMRGTGADVSGQTKLTDALLGDDMQQWLKNVMGIQGAGMQGEQGFYDQGYNAASSMGSDLSNVLGTKAQLAFQGQANQNQQAADKRNAWMNLFGQFAGGAGGALVKAFV